MKKIYVLTRNYDSDDASEHEVIAVSENLRTLNMVMRYNVRCSGVLNYDADYWDEDESEFLTDDPIQRNVCYAHVGSPFDYTYETWEIVEREVL